MQIYELELEYLIKYLNTYLYTWILWNLDPVRPRCLKFFKLALFEIYFFASFRKSIWCAGVGAGGGVHLLLGPLRPPRHGRHPGPLLPHPRPSHRPAPSGDPWDLGYVYHCLSGINILPVLLCRWPRAPFSGTPSSTSSWTPRCRDNINYDNVAHIIRGGWAKLV